ncbi:MAG: hypothetical protein Q7R91_01560 [bacterium]|nr:hypothetical protein [bacterium]
MAEGLGKLIVGYGSARGARFFHPHIIKTSSAQHDVPQKQNPREVMAYEAGLKHGSAKPNKADGKPFTKTHVEAT